MRKFSLLIIGLLLFLPTQAVKYYAETSWGYAGNVTGGGNATPTLVDSYDELKNALKSNSVVIITKNITITSQIPIEGKSNITILALPGTKLVNTDERTKASSGIFAIKNGCSNIILRNITFEGPGAFDCDGRDNLTITGSQNIWVDHCDFQDGIDGNFDINSTSDNITVTWCRFRYFKAPIWDSESETKDHRFSNLIGSSATDKPSDGTYNITYGFCWWDEGCKQRMTRCRNSELHFLNCYWNSSVADYYIGPENASCYFEGCTFVPGKNTIVWSPFNNSSNACKFVNCSGNPSNSGSVSAPSYTYDKLKADKALEYVTKGSCGAGATLTVTTSGEVSSLCPDEEGPGTPSDECCVDLSLGAAPTASNNGIPEDYNLLSVTANLTKGTWVNGYLNMGGNADYITFDFSAYSLTIESVSFDVTIPNWEAEKNTIAYHWNNESNKTYNISSKNKEIVQLTAPTNAKSFTIQRSAGTSTRISEVCFKTKKIATDIEDPQTKNAAQKVLRNGQLLIIKDGKTYNVLGLNQ